jgi:hypothetical protein
MMLDFAMSYVGSHVGCCGQSSDEAKVFGNSSESTSSSAPIEARTRVILHRERETGGGVRVVRGVNVHMQAVRVKNTNLGRCLWARRGVSTSVGEAATRPDLESGDSRRWGWFKRVTGMRRDHGRQAPRRGGQSGSVWWPWPRRYTSFANKRR